MPKPGLAAPRRARCCAQMRCTRGQAGVAVCSNACYTDQVTRTIAQRELRNRNAQILDAVEAGASFVVTRNGEPIAELRPLARGRRQFVPKVEIATMAAQGPHIDGAAFRHDLDEAADQGLAR